MVTVASLDCLEAQPKSEMSNNRSLIREHCFIAYLQYPRGVDAARDLRPVHRDGHRSIAARASG